MLISTMNDLPGYEVTEVLGEVFGITVRSRNVGSQFGAGLKSIVGGELKGMTKMLNDSRSEAQDRLVEAAQQRGADAVLAMRFDANDLWNIGQEICAYGTAVKISKLGASSKEARSERAQKNGRPAISGPSGRSLVRKYEPIAVYALST
jgi:uncharacterized protein YbjQ (UPF0145 family)